MLETSPVVSYKNGDDTDDGVKPDMMTQPLFFFLIILYYLKYKLMLLIVIKQNDVLLTNKDNRRFPVKICIGNS